jgi:hypothetical protein
MATYYCDCDLATGNNDGTTWANAWQTLQRAVDGTGGTQPNAGDVVLCRGTDTVSAVVDFDGPAGTASGFVTFRGVNASGTNDGTRFVVDANGATTSCIKTGCDCVCLENFDIKGAVGSSTNGHGIYAAGYTSLDGWLFINCYIHNNAGSGVYENSAGVSGTFINCRFEANGVYGVYCGGTQNHFINCRFLGNTSDGLIRTGNCLQMSVINCLIHANGGRGIEDQDTGFIRPTFVLNSVIDGNTGDGIETGASDGPHLYAIGCRITENGADGIDSDSISVVGWTYMPDTGQARDNNAKTSGTIHEILVAGSTTNSLSGTDADGGYTDPANDDFNLTATATLKRVAYSLDTINVMNITAGLVPTPDFPAVGNVQSDETVDGATGTLTLPAVEDVETGVQYGAGGTEYTGTLSASGGGSAKIIGG